MSRSLRSNKQQSPGPFSSSENDIDIFDKKSPKETNIPVKKPTRRKSKIIEQDVEKRQSQTKGRSRSKTRVLNENEESAYSVPHISLNETILSPLAPEIQRPLPSVPGTVPCENEKVSIRNLLFQNIYYFVGLFVFGAGTMILYSQIENKRLVNNFYIFAEIIKLCFRNEEDLFPKLERLKSKINIDSILITMIGSFLFLSGGYIYLKAKVTETKDTSDLHNAASSKSNNLNSNNNETSSEFDPTKIFLKQIAIYKERLKTQSLSHNINLIWEYLKVKLFRIILTTTIIIFFVLIRITYSNRHTTMEVLKNTGLVFGKLILISLLIILATQAISYYIRTRREKQKIVMYLSNIVKNRLTIYNGNEYPIEFMLEDIIDIVSDHIMKLRKNANEQLSDTPNINQQTNIGYSTTPLTKQMADSSQSIPINIDLNFEPYLIKRIWKEIQTEVNKGKLHSNIRFDFYIIIHNLNNNLLNIDKRIQVVSVMYHGANRKCWRRLDLIPRSSTSTTQPRHVTNIKQSNISTEPYKSDEGYDWEQSIVGRPSITRGTPVTENTYNTTAVRTGL